MIALSFVIGILPGIIISIVFFHYFYDNNESRLKYLFIFVFGCISCYLTHKIENKVGSYFPEMIDMRWYMVYLYAIFGVSIYEEGFKLIFTCIFSLQDNNTIKSLLLKSVICSMGFATFENIFYYLAYRNINIAIGRMLFAVPSHLCFAIIMGVLLGKCVFSTKKINKLKYLLLSFIIPSLVHATYNVFLYKNIYYLIIVNKVFYICLIFYSINLVFKLEE